MTVQSFPPLVALNCRVLVLGSMPGALSLAKREYYGHPRNAFWPIMAHLCGFDVDASYDLRCTAVTQSGIAVWDVLSECTRPGSLDSAIVRATERPNDIPRLLHEHPSIQSLWLNGQPAASMLRRHYPELLPRVAVLPSTSPANAGKTLAEKQAIWREAFLRAHL